MTDNDNGEVLQYNGNLSQEDRAIALWSDVVHHVARAETKARSGGDGRRDGGSLSAAMLD